MLETQPRLDAAAAAAMGIAESALPATALERAVERVTNLASMSRAALEAYAELSRHHIRRHVEEHFALGLRHQLGLLADPGFRDRVAKVLG
jgi:enoyl-CoA hydratase/carnithine racemase